MKQTNSPIKKFSYNIFNQFLSSSTHLLSHKQLCTFFIFFLILKISYKTRFPNLPKPSYYQFGKTNTKKTPFKKKIHKTKTQRCCRFLFLFLNHTMGFGIEYRLILVTSKKLIGDVTIRRSLLFRALLCLKWIQLLFFFFFFFFGVKRDATPKENDKWGLVTITINQKFRVTRHR